LVYLFKKGCKITTFLTKVKKEKFFLQKK
jgi:hypothetical protein